MKSALISRVTSDLRDATNIVICDFQPPGGSIITRVIRGKFIRPGQYWNSPMFPKGPVLAYENLTDHLGESSGPVMLQLSSYFRLDPTMKFVVLESLPDDPEQKEDVLIPLQDIEARLKQSGEAAPENR